MNRRDFLKGVSSVAVSGCNNTVPTKDRQKDPVSSLPADGLDPAVLKIAVTPSSGARTDHAFSPLITYLAQRDLDSTVVVAKGYDHLEKLVASGDVHAAIFSPLAYVKAKRKGLPAVPIATATRSGSPTYIGYLVIRGKDPQPLEALRGKRISWVDKSSTSGYLYPRAMLRERGLDPDTFFDNAGFAGNHKKALERLFKAEVDVVAVASPFVDAGASKGVIPDGEYVTVVAKTARIPLDCVVVHDKLKRERATELRAALLDLMWDPTASRDLADKWGSSGFVEVVQAGYDEVSRVYDAHAEDR